MAAAAKEEERLEFTHGHLAGQTGIAYALESPKDEEGGKDDGDPVPSVHLITGGADCTASLRTEDTGFKETETDINDHEEVITCLAANAVPAKGPRSSAKTTDLFATGSEDRFVKVYAYPDAVFETNATRFELPVRAIDFAPDGRTIAAGGDDQGVRIVEVEVENAGSADSRKVACKLVRTLRTTGRSVKSIRWDPEGVFVAAVSSDGSLQVWNAKSGEAALSRKGFASKFDASSPPCAHVSWHPEGIHLAVPGTSGDVVFLERLSWEEEFVLPSSADGETLGHQAPVTCVEMSPNGMYAATAGLDRRVVVWSLKDQKPVSVRMADAVVCNVRWHPHRNAVSLLDEEGNFSHWKSPVDANLASPYLVVEEDDDKAAAKEGNRSESHLESEDGARGDGGTGRKAKRAKIMESDSEDSGSEDEGFRTNKGGPGQGAMAATATGRQGPAAADLANVLRRSKQRTFQPGATPLGVRAPRRFLAYNMQGSISTLRGQDYNSVEVVFHDVSTRSSRIPTLTDYFGFELGALGPNGTILASMEKGEGKQSVLMYRPFESWAAGSDWTATFPAGEEVRAVAVGSTFVAAATQSFLRLYSLAGSPRSLLSLPGPVVAMAAFESTLACVYQDVAGALSFHLYDTAEESLVAGGALCANRGTDLEWLGFSEDGVLSAWDGETLRGYFPGAYGGAWVPLFLSAKARKAETEHHYIVGLDVEAREVFCVITKSADHYPQVVPRPIITTLSLELPLVGAEDQGARALHQDLMFQRLGRSQSASAQAASVEVQMDKTLLRLIAGAIKGDKCELAFQYAHELNFQRSLRGALKLANANRRRALSERLSEMLSNRESVVPVASVAAEKANVFARKRVYGESQ